MLASSRALPQNLHRPQHSTGGNPIGGLIDELWARFESTFGLVRILHLRWLLKRVRIPAAENTRVRTASDTVVFDRRRCGKFAVLGYPV
jgi:hypothetical protein